MSNLNYFGFKTFEAVLEQQRQEGGIPGRRGNLQTLKWYDSGLEGTLKDQLFGISKLKEFPRGLIKRLFIKTNFYSRKIAVV